MRNDTATGDGWQVHDEQGFLGLVGPVLERWQDGRPQLAFTAQDKHRNKIGVVQGGMLVTLVDRAMGVAAYAAVDRKRVATIQLDTHFLAAAQVDDFIVARPDVVRVTRSVVFVEARVCAGDRVLLTAKGIWKILGED